MTAYEEYGNDEWWEVQYFSTYYRKWMTLSEWDTEEEAQAKMVKDESETLALGKDFKYRVHKVRGIGA